jgi:hypothetical protein
MLDTSMNAARAAPALGRCFMFVNVGRFQFRPMGQDGWQGLIQRIEGDMTPVVRESQGFRGVYFARPSDNELMLVWHWDSVADWQAAFARLGPFLQEYVIPNLAQAPDRVGSDVVLQILP